VSADRPVSGRDLAQARRVEHGAIGLRWLVVAFGVAEAAFALRDTAQTPGYALPLSFVLVAGLAIGNVVVSTVTERATRIEQLEWIGFLGFALDVIVVIGLIWTSAVGPADPIWVIGYVLPLEGAIRWGLRGALAPVAVFLVSEVFREISLSERYASHPFMGGAVAFRVGMGLTVAIVSGLMARSLEREAEKARERARTAEDTAELAERSARRETEARRQVAAFHAAILAGVAAENVDESIQSMANQIGRDLQCESIAVLLVDTDADGHRCLVAKGVHGDPGYEREQRLPLDGPDVWRAAMAGRPELRDAPAEAVVPLKVSGEVIGVLHERASAAGAIDRERLLLLGRVADQIGLVVQAVRLRARQEETLRRLTELDEMKSDFVAITSHELRTPLAAIRGFINTLRRRLDELTGDETREFLEIVDQQTDRLIHLVEDLLVVSRIEAGKLSVVSEPVVVSELLDGVTHGLGDEAGRIRRIDSADLPTVILADGQRLGQILTNLLQNALKFSAPATNVTLLSERGEGAIRFSVIDEGAGVPREEFQRIFERFHQTDSASTRRSEGAGLGLYITKQLVDAMGGSITIESEVGVGSTFSVTLPERPATPAPARLSGATLAD
jgi:signal transduction histidine kinase